MLHWQADGTPLSQQDERRWPKWLPWLIVIALFTLIALDVTWFF